MVGTQDFPESLTGMGDAETQALPAAYDDPAAQLMPAPADWTGLMPAGTGVENWGWLTARQVIGSGQAARTIGDRSPAQRLAS